MTIPSDRLDQLLGLKLRLARNARDLAALNLDHEARVLETIALHVQREIETTEQAEAAGK